MTINSIEMDSKGYEILTGFLSPSELAAMRQHLGSLGTKPGLKGDQSGGPEFEFIPDVATRSTQHLGQDWVSNLAGLFTDNVGPNIGVVSSSAVSKRANGSSTLPWHQDSVAVDVQARPLVSIVIAIDELDESNGCLEVIPGSHKRGLLPHTPGPFGLQADLGSEPIASLPVVLKAGDAVVLSGGLVHRAGKNNSSTKVTDLTVILVPWEEGRNLTQVLREKASI